jgi:hypothetical protein
MIAHLFLFMLKIIYIHEKKKCFPPLHEFQIVSSIQKGLNELAGVSVSLTFHSALRKLNTDPSIGASHHISAHFGKAVSEMKIFRNQPI